MNDLNELKSLIKVFKLDHSEQYFCLVKNKFFVVDLDFECVAELSFGLTDFIRNLPLQEVEITESDGCYIGGIVKQGDDFCLIMNFDGVRYRLLNLRKLHTRYGLINNSRDDFFYF